MAIGNTYGNDGGGASKLGTRSCTRNGRFSNMEAYDRLPKAVRQELANANLNWAAASAYDGLRLVKNPKTGKRYTTKEVIAKIREHEAAESERYTKAIEDGFPQGW